MDLHPHDLDVRELLENGTLVSLGEGADAGVVGGKEGAQGLEPALDEGRLRPSRPALLAYRPRRLGPGGQHLSQVPPEAALHDPASRARSRWPPRSGPCGSPRRACAARGAIRSRSAQAVDEDRGRSVHTVCLESSEYSVNTVRRVLAAPVLARPRGDFPGDRPEGRRPARADRLERRPAILISPRAGSSPPLCTRRDGGGAAGRRQAWAEDGSRRMRKSRSRETVLRLSRFWYRRRKALALQGPRRLPKLDVAGSTPVARSRGNP